MAIEKLRIIAFNESDSATLTSEPAINNISTLPIDNVKNGSHSRVYRNTTIDTVGVTIKGNLNQPKYFSGLVLYRHNLNAFDKIQLVIYSGSNQTGSIVYDSGLTNALDAKNIADIDWGIEPLESTVFDDEEWNIAYSVHWFSQVAGQSFEIKIISDNNPDGYIEIGRIFLGRYITPSFNFNYGYEMDWVDPSQQKKTAGNTTFIHKKQKYRKASITLSWLNELDRSQFFELLRRVGHSREMFVSLAPGSTGRLERDGSMACYLRSHSPVSQPSHNHHILKLALEES